MKMSFADAVRRNGSTASATDKEIEMKLKLWLRGAVDRQGGRAFRMNKARAAATDRHDRATMLIDGRASSQALIDSDSGDSPTALVGRYVQQNSSDEEVESMWDLR